MAKILFLTQVVPFPPDAGPKVKTYHVIKALVHQGHSVTLLSFVRPEEMQYSSALEEICDTVYLVPIRRLRIADVGYMIKSFVTGIPFLVERDNLRPMQEMVNELVQKYDFQFIHADQLTMVQFALRGISNSRHEKPKVIFDAHNAVWVIVERMKKTASWFLKPILAIEAKRIKQYEGELMRVVDHVLTVTDIDRESLEGAYHDSSEHQHDRISPITVIPIAVDTQKLQPINRMPGSKNIVTLGTLHYPPNADGIRWFFTSVFPLIQELVPEATLTIIGKNPPRDFLELADRTPKTINVVGYVNDLVPYLEKSALMVVPVRTGGGMRVRILEAFAYAMPVVTTTVGLEGIRGKPNHDVLVADTASDFAGHVSDLLLDTSLQDKLASNGRKLADAKYDWKSVLRQMNAIYQ